MADDKWVERNQSEVLRALVSEDLSAYGVGELEARITALEGEIARSRADIVSKEGTLSAAEQLFKK
ncbi:MAG: uncharacterized small protein (DUF1192 family) [Parvibaculaceae bacterium]|jgi:uncharacterized small protein (DUF1192 family)|nr:DUF1192 domain-containing protein [Parvibaculaceae bacterium]